MASQGLINNSSGSPAAVTATTNLVKLQHPGYKLLFVKCEASGRQFLVDGGSAVTLWQQVHPLPISISISVLATIISSSFLKAIPILLDAQESITSLSSPICSGLFSHIDFAHLILSTT